MPSIYRNKVQMGSILTCMTKRWGEATREAIREDGTSRNLSSVIHVGNCIQFSKRFKNLTSLFSCQWLKNLAGWSGRWDRRLTASQSSHMRIVARHPYLTCSGQEIAQSLVFHHTPPLGKMLMNMSNLEAASQYCTTVCTLTVSSMITSH